MKNASVRTIAMAVFAATMMAAAPTMADAQARGAARGARTTPDGDVVRGSVAGATDGEGAGVIRGRRTYVTEEGDVYTRSGACAAGPAGAACRRGSTEIGADGSVAHEGEAGFVTDTAEGYSSGSFYRDAEGGVRGGRTTSVEGEAGSYNAESAYGDGVYNRSSTAVTDEGSREVETNYEAGVGGSRTVTCYDATGAVVACPTRN